MTLYTTSILAIDPISMELTEYCGPHIPAISFDNAREYCDNNGLGYCFITGILVAEIDEKGNVVDYDNEKNN
jgi:hypothetical protein